MSTQTVTLFLALLGLTAELSVVVAVALAIAGRWSETAARWRRDLAAAVRPSAVGFAFAVALVATLGSLYFSEVAHFVPCKLCWYQRIAMYPLVPILGLAAWRRDGRIWPYGTLVATLGAAISTYHVLLERFPDTLETSACDPTNPCTIIWVERLGYLTIPTMALSGFALIITLLLLARSGGTALSPPQEER
jgi:disulfide bond formation protein DsbB